MEKRHRWLQFRLSTLIALVGCCAIVFWATAVLLSAWKERQLVRSRLERFREPDGWGTTVHGLAEIGPRAVPHLIEALHDEDERIQRGAAQALGRIGAPAVPKFIDALDKGNDVIRCYAYCEFLESLGPDATKAALPDLIEALKHKNHHVGRWASEAIGRIGPHADAAIPPLVELLNREHENSVRGYAVGALARIGHQAVPSLIELMNTADADLQAMVVLALGAVGPDANPAAVPVLVRALQGKEGLLACYAAEALGKIGVEDEATVRALSAALNGNPRDAALRANAAAALGNAKTDVKELAIRVLRDALRDQHPGVRGAAADALKKLDPEAAS